MHVKMRAGGETIQRFVILRNVVFVPALESNLISLGALCDDQHKTVLGRNGFSARREGVLQFQGLKHRGLYVVTGRLAARECRALTAMHSEELWHQRLGHAKMDTIRKLCKYKSVSGLLMKPKSPGHKCESCVDAKIVRHDSKFSQRRATSVGQVIHSDLCGPMSELSLGGILYFTTFIDECSGWIYVAAVRNKSEVFAEFRKFMVWFERRFDCVIKRLHSDGGGKYLQIKYFVRKLEIESTKSPRYSPNQNSIAERANRTI